MNIVKEDRIRARISVSYKSAYLAVALLGAAKVALVLSISQSDSSLGPDEGTYAELAATRAAGASTDSWSGGWGSSLFPSTRSFLFPASLLIKIGIEDLTAVRLTSLVYGILSQVVFIALLYFLQKKNNERLHLPDAERLSGLPLAGVLIFTLFPSNNAWSMIGLRETTGQFWAIVTVSFAVLILMVDSKLRIKILIAIAGSLSLSFLFQSRDEIGFAIALALSITAIAWVKNKQRVSVLLLLTSIVGASLGAYMASPTDSRPSLTESLGIQLTQLDTDQLDTDQPDTDQPDTDQPDTDQPDTDQPDTAPNVIDGLLTTVQDRRKQLSEGAGSAFDPISCPSASGVLSNSSVCEISRFPLALFSVTFRPLWPIDALPSDSTISTMATVENSLWLVLFIVTLIALTRNYSLAPRVTLLLIIFVFIVLAGMAVIEGNLGTAFRHKSQVLWAVCMLLSLASGPPKRSLLTVRPRHDSREDHSQILDSK